MKWFAVICALLVACCWGMYGPTLSMARSPERLWGPFKPYIFIGVAYLVIAIIGGSMMMRVVFNDNFDYRGKYFPAMKWGFLAGCLGALGALALTFALTKAEGKPAYVMPIVFGGAVTVNAIAAFFMHRGTRINPLMWIGMLLVAVGICLTAGYTPHGHASAAQHDEPVKWFAVVCGLMVAACWGLYGPTLSQARSPERLWGPFKPYIFIGVAYLVIAIMGGALMMKLAFNDNFDYSGIYFPAMKWGFLAGCLGALGALSLTFALTKAGGKPAYVMPIVFGGAVTVNAIAAFFTHYGEPINPLMWLGMLLVAIGICLTAGYTPHGHAPPPKPDPE